MTTETNFALCEWLVLGLASGALNLAIGCAAWRAVKAALRRLSERTEVLNDAA